MSSLRTRKGDSDEPYIPASSPPMPPSELTAQENFGCSCKDNEECSKCVGKNRKGLRNIKVQLWMRGQSGENKMKFYKTITPTQFAQIVVFVSSPSPQ